MSIGALWLCIIAAAQQEIPMPPIPPSHDYHHEQIISSLKNIARLAHKTDTLFPVTGNLRLDQSINKSVKIKVNNMRAAIESNSSLSDNAKFKWLRGVNEMLSAFISGYRNKMLQSAVLPAVVKAYEDAMQADLAGNSILDIIRENEPETGNILIDNFALKDNPGIPAGKDILVLKHCQRYPKEILRILTKYPNNRYADSLIIKAAFQNQEELYNYAAVPNDLGRRIQSINHPLVKIISRLSLSKTGRMYFPFLDNLYRGKLSIDSIRPLVSNDSSSGYYKLLVRTRIDYAARMQKGDTPMAAMALTNKLKSKAIELYINEINALHDQANEKIRFRVLDDLGPEDLYYLAVMGEEEMYTSSFVVGVYPRIFQRMKAPSSDSLLLLLQHDYYKKFIKMSAAYNTLDNFLGRMDKAAAEKMMRNFVTGLELTTSLEDAVDVADSYASIFNPELRKLILAQLQYNLNENKKRKNSRGALIYDLMLTIFQSMDPANKIDLTARLGINPVYIMPRKSLQDSTGRVIIQQFSYGDKDATVYFSAFMNRFGNANWKIIRKPFWVEINSAHGAPVTIYANLPLDEKQELDIMAQDSLISYLDGQNLVPSMVIHRGHSYYLQETIDRLSAGAKIVLLGSCGGYQKLNDILKICPTAHIISSKQVAAGVVNQSLIDAISEQLRLGKDLNWEQLWKTVQIRVGKGYKDKFDDYIPPHKNLGAIFIMAYQKNGSSY
ncbi:MAG: hypothetical protein RLZZ28_2198 [Bacteroidota bacterium]